MTPQRQTVFVDTHPKGWGNCQSAAMASILDMPLSEVIDTTDEKVRADGFWEPINHWLNKRGLKMTSIGDSVGPGDERLKGKYSLGCGPSPRGAFWHVVVCKHGRMVFDPHPSDDGLLEIVRHDLIVEMTDVEKCLFAFRKEAALEGEH